MTERLGGEGGRNRDAAEDQGGGGPGEEREGTQRAPRGGEGGLGHLRTGVGGCCGTRARASAAAPLDPDTLACPERRVPSPLECGAPLSARVAPSSFLALPLLGPAPRAELGAPQWPLPAPPGPGAAALPACWTRSESRARRQPRLFGSSPLPASGSPAAARARQLRSRTAALRVTGT